MKTPVDVPDHTTIQPKPRPPVQRHPFLRRPHLHACYGWLVLGAIGLLLELMFWSTAFWTTNPPGALESTATDLHRLRVCVDFTHDLPACWEVACNSYAEGRSRHCGLTPADELHMCVLYNTSDEGRMKCWKTYCFNGSCAR